MKHEFTISNSLGLSQADIWAEIPAILRRRSECGELDIHAVKSISIKTVVYTIEIETTE